MTQVFAEVLILVPCILTAGYLMCIVIAIAVVVVIVWGPKTLVRASK